MDRRFRLEIPIVWQFVRQVRRQLADALADQSEDLRDSAMMVASELVENAIKYGESVPGAPTATIELFVEPERVMIEVKNGLSSARDAQAVQEQIARLRAAEDPAALYVERLKELLESPDIRGRLGLCRIALEAGFDLSCTYDQQILTISASRGTA